MNHSNHHFGNHFAINTYSYTQSLSAADCLRHLADKGVDAFELMFYPGHVWIDDDPARLREIRDVIAANNLKLISMNSPNIDLNIAAATGEMRALSLDLNKAYLRIAAELGATALILGPGKANPLFPLPAQVLEGYFFEALDVLVPLAAGLDVEIFVENMPFAFLPAADELMASLARYGNDDLKVCYDIANAHFVKEDPVVGLQSVAPRLALIHVSDTTQAVYRHDAVGKGDIDFSRLPEAITGVGYRQSVMLEIISGDADRDIADSVSALRRDGF
jgi:sugar phosphate isomerase/epimerase